MQTESDDSMCPARVCWTIKEMVSGFRTHHLIFIAALRITPNMVTVSLARSRCRRGHRLWLVRPTSVLAVIATFYDIIDEFSRKLGTASAPGQVIDAAVNRYGEMFLFGGLIYYRGTNQVLLIMWTWSAFVPGELCDGEGGSHGVAAPRRHARQERAAYIITSSAFTPVFATLFGASPSLALKVFRCVGAPEHHRRGFQSLRDPAADGDASRRCARKEVLRNPWPPSTGAPHRRAGRAVGREISLAAEGGTRNWARRPVSAVGPPRRSSCAVHHRRLRRRYGQRG